MSLSKKDIETIQKRHNELKKFENVHTTKIYIKPSRFRCNNCMSQMMERYGQHGRKETVKFRCKECKKESEYIYDMKKGYEIDFEEYSQEMTKLVDKHRENKGERFER